MASFDLTMKRLRKPSTSTSVLRLPSSVLHAIGAAVIAMAAFVLAAAAAPWTDFNPDESRWLSRAHYLYDLTDPFGPTWADQYMTRGQPPLGSYAMAVGLLLHGRDLQTNPPWDFTIPWEANIARGNEPLPADLLAGRRTSAFFVALTALCLIAIARLFVAPVWALVAGAVYAAHPFTMYLGSLAMSDALFGFLIALAALTAAAFARRPGWPRAILLGVLLGLGGAAKLTPLAVAFTLFFATLAALVVATVRYRQVPSRERSLAARAATMLVAACATFLAVYPYLWPDPLARTRHLVTFRVTEMATQASDWPVMAVSTRAEALRRVAVNFTEHYSLSASLASWFGGASPLPIRQTEVAVALLGILVMIVMAARAGPYSPRALALAVLGAQVAITILGMRSEFDRYHLPTALLGAISLAVALEWLVRAMPRLFAAARSSVRLLDHTHREPIADSR